MKNFTDVNKEWLINDFIYSTIINVVTKLWICDFAIIYNKLPYSFNIRHGQNSVNCHMMNSSTSIPGFC